MPAFEGRDGSQSGSPAGRDPLPRRLPDPRSSVRERRVGQERDPRQVPGVRAVERVVGLDQALGELGRRASTSPTATSAVRSPGSCSGRSACPSSPGRPRRVGQPVGSPHRERPDHRALLRPQGRQARRAAGRPGRAEQHQRPRWAVGGAPRRPSPRPRPRATAHRRRSPRRPPAARQAAAPAHRESGRARRWGGNTAPAAHLPHAQAAAPDRERPVHRAPARVAGVATASTRRSCRSGTCPTRSSSTSPTRPSAT